MLRLRIKTAACLAGCALLTSGLASLAWANECSIDSTLLDRGQRKPFFICGEAIPAEYRLAGLAGTGIEIVYDQPLRSCAMDDNRRGIFFWLEAQADATSATLKIMDPNGATICDAMPIDVPDRVPAGTASLTASRSPNSPIHRLQIAAAPGQDFSTACAEGLQFPAWPDESSGGPPRWPALRLLTDADMPDIPLDLRTHHGPMMCSAAEIDVLVHIRGQQREPAKIVIPAVRLTTGERAEAIAYARLPEPAWADAMRDADAKFVDVDGIRTRYWEAGNGPALVLVHGGQPTGKGGGALTWMGNLDGLSAQFHVYALDRLGQGGTDNPRTRDDYEHYYERVAEHLAGFLDALDIERVALVGHSQGGWPVTRVALDQPDRVRCLVNVDSVLAPGGERNLNLHTARYYMHTTQFHPPGGETLESLRRTDEFQSATLNNITDASVARAYALTQLPKLEEAAAIMSEMQMNPRHRDAQALFEAARAEIAGGKLKVPSLVIWGYDDPSSPYPGGLALFELINATTPVSELHVFNSAGHQSHIEYPDEFNVVVAGFCRKYFVESAN